VDGKLEAQRIQGLDCQGLDVSRIVFDRDGAMWEGTGSHGLFRIDKGHVQHFDSVYGLSDDHVSDIFQDKEGTLWVTTNGGVDRFVRINVTKIAKMPDGLTAETTQSVSSSKQASIHLELQRSRYD
jgi:ligand-binding sensor domain-containing protein